MSVKKRKQIITRIKGSSTFLIFLFCSFRYLVSMKAKDIASRSFWRSMPAGSMFHFLLAVFFIFAPVGFIMDIWQHGEMSIEGVWLSVLYSGLVSISYAYSFTRNLKVLPLAVIFQFGFQIIPWMHYFPGGPETEAEIQGRLIFDGVGIIVCIILAYVIFIRFITREGIKRIELLKEMELAGEIHRVLVPEIDLNDSRFEITGRSKPTDEVGGDLIDLIGHEKGIIAYMIDVSGHGVGPGLLSGMFKASFRSIFEEGKTLISIVNNLNRVLLDQRKKGMFITFGGMRFYDNDHIEILLAGHPPIIRIDQNGELEELKLTQLPLLAIHKTDYKNNTIASKSGDLFIIYSDGIIETTNKKGEEFGFERLRKILKASFLLPTDKISERVYTELNTHGVSRDDQSLIVIRRK